MTKNLAPCGGVSARADGRPRYERSPDPMAFTRIEGRSVVGDFDGGLSMRVLTGCRRTRRIGHRIEGAFHRRRRTRPRAAGLRRPAAAHPAKQASRGPRVMAAEVDQRTGAPAGARSAERTNHRNGYRERPWRTRAGRIDLAIPKLRTGSYFPSFLEPSIVSKTIDPSAKRRPSGDGRAAHRREGAHRGDPGSLRPRRLHPRRRRPRQGRGRYRRLEEPGQPPLR